jgi:DNA-binding transcriptional ArsR family regulator
MVEYSQKTSTILKAVSDGTRRSILTLLCQQGPTRVTDVASHYRMSLNAVSKHIKALESAGLIKRTTIGRVHLIEADLEQFYLIREWLSEMESIWSLRLKALEEILTPKIKDDEKNDHDE